MDTETARRNGTATKAEKWQDKEVSHNKKDQDEDLYGANGEGGDGDRDKDRDEDRQGREGEEDRRVTERA